jgi:hypothetical protein
MSASVDEALTCRLSQLENAVCAILTTRTALPLLRKTTAEKVGLTDQVQGLPIVESRPKLFAAATRGAAVSGLSSGARTRR